MEQEQTKLDTAVSSGETDSTSDYIETIKQLKANTVDKSLYNKALSENKELLNALAEGRSVEVEKREDKKPLEHYARKILEINKDPSMSIDLNYAKTILEFRDRCLEESDGKFDPFLKHGKISTNTLEDTQTAEKFSDCLRQWIDEANGDSEVFMNELIRNTAETGIAGRR